MIAVHVDPLGLCPDDHPPVTSLADFVDRGCPMVLGGPLPHVMAAKAVALAEAARPDFADYAQRIVTNARALAEGLLRRGATLVTGGTDNHLVLLDVSTSYGLTGRQAESALLDAGCASREHESQHGSPYVVFGHGGCVNRPPSTQMVCPVMKSLSSDERKITVPTRS